MKYLSLLLAAWLCLGWAEHVTAQTLSAKLKAEAPTALATAAREKGNAVRGAILFPQQKFACANCHATGANNLLGPDLAQLDDKATDEYLVESLLAPSKVIRKGFETVTVVTVKGQTVTGRLIEEGDKSITLRDTSPRRQLITLNRDEIEEQIVNKKSAMPDNLLDQMENRQQFLDLVRYLMTLRDSGSQPASLYPQVAGEKLSEAHQGLVLLDKYLCTNCHQNDLVQTSLPVKQAPDLKQSAERIDPHHLEKFIAAPHRMKPGTSMPSMMSHLPTPERQQASREIAHYLVSLGKEPFQRQPLDKVAAGRGRKLFHSVGCVACHSPRDSSGKELLSEDSVPLGLLEQKYNLNGLTSFLKNPHLVRSSGRMPNMKLTHWEALDISHYLLSRNAAEKPAKRVFHLDQALARKGQQRFSQLNCNQCHQLNQQLEKKTYPALSRLKDGAGCLSQTSGNWPRYQLKTAEQKAIKAALIKPEKSLTDQETISLTLTTLNCVRCHQRGELGGIPPERESYFETTNPNLGPQGRIPPTLSNVGGKLQPKWMRQVLVSGRSIRPYMKTRMPQCGTKNVGFLVDLFQRVDQSPEVEFAKLSDQKKARNAGHQLAGTSGLNCIACHTFQQKPAATMPAVDLTEMGERLKKPWFYQYMRNPQRLSQGTVMPSFWPGGKAIRQDVLNGHPDQQLEALWQYLQEGRQARIPEGLIRQPIELLATDEAVMLRRSYPGIGKRGIGVGYPGQVNLAFDAEQMRLAMIWKGKFAEPSGVWRGQGHGTVRPLGTDLLRFPAGPELNDAKTPWKVDKGRPPERQFQGYELDELRRPRFQYRFRNVQVTDYPQDVKDKQTGKMILRRTLTFTAGKPQEKLTFRVATHANIVKESPGVFRVDRQLRIRIDSKYSAQIVPTESGRQLQIPLLLGQGTSTLVLEYLW